MTNDIVVFDLDNTLIELDSGDRWLEFMVALKIPGATEALTSCRSIMPARGAGHIDIERYMYHWLKPLTGWSINQLNPLIDTFIARAVAPAVYQQGRAALVNHTQRGHKVLLISATPDILVGPIARFLNINHSIGIQVEQQRNIITGNVIPPISFQQGKVECLKRWLDCTPDHKVIMAYSDSENDLPLLRYAQHACCINPNPFLHSTAVQQGWQVKQWHIASNEISHE
ncbi:HAD family hydrolase [Alteromonas gilva]|uniref:HAD-IB family hydrolase n=1 Tax=Alteromonas gilva TaxID=2987522 RepID=A0ABT5L0F2_9ALTE|nr:HAD family hydrolase [Alteromonas gilva]MDC8829357.1 HAD-IB family hydrolase [Alteromonas gilva]